MAKTNEMRVSVAKYNRPFVNSICNQLGCTGSEAVNFIIAKSRMNETVNANVIQQVVDVASSPVVQQNPAQFDVQLPPSFYSEVDSIVNQMYEEPDPVIVRLAGLIENF